MQNRSRQQQKIYSKENSSLHSYKVTFTDIVRESKLYRTHLACLKQKIHQDKITKKLAMLI